MRPNNESERFSSCINRKNALTQLSLQQFQRMDDIDGQPATSNAGGNVQAATDVRADDNLGSAVDDRIQSRFEQRVGGFGVG